MSGISTVEFHVTLAAEQIHNLIMLHEKEISEHLEAGLKAAIEKLPVEIEKHAETAVLNAIRRSIDRSLDFGSDAEALDKIVKPIIRDFLRKKLGEGKLLDLTK